MKLFFGMGLWILCVLMPWQQTKAEECLRFGAPDDITGRNVGQMFMLVMAYHDICTSIKYLPNKRSTETLLSGEIDGEILRIGEYKPGKEGEFIRVPTAIGGTQRLLISRHNDIKALDDLKDGSLGIWLGAIWHNEFSKNVTNRVRLPSFDVMVAMLLNDRIDAILMDSATFKLYKTQIPPEYVHEQGIEKFYTWINRGKSAQVPVLDQAIAAYHRNGPQFYIKAMMQ
ncbi:hypothetical protein ACQ0MK_12360 [Thalassospira lucentensis]|uniref:hypothetical protein n=1 Tax=Thalassospira lucentensis TaxID=168935 RepID=UPI003D2EC58D